LLYKQLLGSSGANWRDQVKRHTEETGKGLDRGVRKALHDGKQEQRIVFSKVSPFMNHDECDK
jgi:hypothetical protein